MCRILSVVLKKTGVFLLSMKVAPEGGVLRRRGAASGHGEVSQGLRDTLRKQALILNPGP